MASLNLSQLDVDRIARLVDTEVPSYLATKNPAEYERMVQAVFDTVTNRVVSPQFPNTVVGVANQRSQFSKINGPSYLNPYGSIDRAPKASQRAQNAVYDYAAARSAGAPATAPNSLNYANPNYSSKSNVTGWISDMIDAGAEKFGIGKSVHYHGLAPGTQPVGPYGVAVAGMPTGPVPTPTAKPETIFSNAAARTVEKAPLNEIMGIDLNRPDTPLSRATPASTMANPFDWGRMAEPTNPVSALNTFDPGRFGPVSVQPSTANFDAGRFGPAPSSVSAKSGRPGVSVGTEVSAERFGYGFDPGTGMRSVPSIIGYSPEELLAMDVEEANPGRAAAQAAKSASYQAAQAAQAPRTTYVDPTVATSYAQQPAAGNSASRAIDRQTTGALGQRIGPDQATLDAATKSAAMNNRLSDMQGRQTTGTLLGGLLGTAVAGPLGGLLGVSLGNKWAGRTGVDYFPSSPGLGGKLAQLFGYDPGNGGMEGLTTNRLADVAAQYGINLSDADKSIYGNMSGRDLANESKQVQDAVQSGKSGLW